MTGVRGEGGGGGAAPHFDGTLQALLHGDAGFAVALAGEGVLTTQKPPQQTPKKSSPTLKPQTLPKVPCHWGEVGTLRLRILGMSVFRLYTG